MLHITNIELYTLRRKKLFRSTASESTRAPVHLRLDHSHLFCPESALPWGRLHRLESRISASGSKTA